ncbi:hypothetical protein SAMN04488095_1246 [Jannaschia pohangensis]|uniref:Leucine Rich repeat-containing protein n=2 Tax=Jannaschia pohangensis TaxID=390807 RepID=A0A1I3J8Y8_9RHOB|nr:hypothetical protein SAMN04488095_1246 [Jannaschia pohangensis]
MAARQFDGERLDLSTLGHVTELSVNTIRKADLKRLRGLDALPLEALALRWLSASDLTVVPMPPGLRALRLWHSSKVKTLDGIEQAPGLMALDLRELGQPLDLLAVAGLRDLRRLSVQGGYGAGQRIVSLAPLSGLPIEDLTLMAVDGADLDLGPVTRMRALRKLTLTGTKLDPAGMAAIKAAHAWFELDA